MRNLIRKLIHFLPGSLEKRVRQLWRSRKLWRFQIRRLGLRLSNTKSNTRYISDDPIYWVDPRKIVFAMNSAGFNQGILPQEGSQDLEFNIYKRRGMILGGDWDRLERRFDDLDFYRSYEERALKGTSWENLPYYRRVLQQIENGINKWECTSKQDLDNRCRSLDNIFNDIQQNGYKSRKMQLKELGKNCLPDSDDEITVNIGRHGDLIFNNARHRLTFAKIAGVEKVPAVVTVRHSEWVDFVKEIEDHVRECNGRVYAPLTHIDLQRIPVHCGNERYETISRNIGEKNSTLLDIGAHLGYFCHRFEEAGFHCTAWEDNPQKLYFLEKLRRAENRNFEVISEPISDLSRKGSLKFDVVLALAVLHRFLNDKASYDNLKRLLKNLDINEMYFEPGPDCEAPVENTFVSYSPEEFAAFILDNSCLTQYKLIEKYEDGGSIYKLWK